ncbi:MAG: RNA methyltransferase [Treponema sp.]|nr:RNA methyltransferase [Treponema sp.]
MRAGHTCAVRLPDGTLICMMVHEIDEKRKTLTFERCGTLTTRAAAQKAPPVDAPQNIAWWLFAFIARPQKMELIIRQAVECGVSCIVPVVGAYSQAGSVAAFTRGRSERIERIIREARTQSGSPIATTVTEALPLSAAMTRWHEATADCPAEHIAAAVLYERQESAITIHQIAAAHPLLQKGAIAVGCERGISPEECAVLQTHGFVPVHFAGNILRCETAALYGIAAFQSAVLERTTWNLNESILSACQ